MHEATSFTEYTSMPAHQTVKGGELSVACVHPKTEEVTVGAHPAVLGGQ